MSLDQIAVLLDAEAAERHQVLEAHVADLDRRMDEMQRSREMTEHALRLPRPRHRHLPAVQAPSSRTWCPGGRIPGHHGLDADAHEPPVRLTHRAPLPSSSCLRSPAAPATPATTRPRPARPAGAPPTALASGLTVRAT